MLQARLFGRLSVKVNGQDVPEIAGLRPRSVFAWLLLHPGRHARARIAARFWPDVLDTSARASLRNALWTIRGALAAVDAAHYLDTGRESVGLAGELPQWVDTAEFDRLRTQGDAQALERCVALAEAPLLADLADDWVLDARDDYRERFAEAILRLAEHAAQRGDPREAAGWCRTALPHVPFRESAHRMLMGNLAAAGEHAEALAAFERCRDALSAEFDTEPSEETRALAQRLRSGDHGRGTVEQRPATPQRREAPLVGRDDELAQMRAAWDRAQGGQGGVAVLTGEAGLGKSRLVRELATRVADQGARLGHGTVFELSGAPPYGPWSEAFRELVADVPAPPDQAAWPADLALLCRSIEWRWGRTATTPSPATEQDRSWLFEAALEGIVWCARDRPLLLVLEDVHLADRATIALLAYVGRQLTRLPVLLVATARPGMARRDLELAFDALEQREAVRAEVTLRPLPPEQTESIVASAAAELTTDIRRQVVAAADGNPLLAREAARAAAAGEDLSRGLRTWVRASLARLPAHARLLVDIAAAAGRPLGLGEAAALTGIEPLADSVAAARQENVVEMRDLRVSFAHTLVRQACYAELDPAHRAWLHGRIADTLKSRPGRSPAEIARHLGPAGRQEEARGYLLSAAREARSVGALDEAVAFLREATALADTAQPASAEVWLHLAEAEAQRGRREEFDAAFNRAREALDATGDMAALAAAYVARGRCLRTSLCFPAEARAASERALEIIADAELEAPELRALALASCAWVEAASGDPGRGEELVTAAEAEAAHDPALTAELTLARGAALLRSRRFAEAEEVSENASRQARRAGRADIADGALTQAAAAAAAGGAQERGLRLAERALRGRCGTGARAQLLAIRSYGLSRLGRHDEARGAARERIDLLARIGRADERATAEYDAGAVALAAGHHAEAVAELRRALDSDSSRFPRALARLRLAEARVQDGDVQGAERELAAFPFEPVGPADLPEALVPHLERVEALAAAARGRLPLAHRRLASAEAGWRRLFAAAPRGDPHAASLIVLGRWGPEGLVEPGVELGRTRAEQALLCVREGALADAGAAAEEAGELAARLGYGGYNDILRQVAQAKG